MKKFLILFIVLLIMTSCSSDGKVDDTSLDPKKPTNIVLWHYYSDNKKRAIEDAVERFNETEGLEKGIIVTPVLKGTLQELEEGVTNSAKGVIGSEDAPDIFSAYPDKAVEIDNLGKLADMSPYFTDEDKSKYVEEFLEAGIYEDKLLMIPIVKSTEVFYLNETDWMEFADKYNLTYKDLENFEGIYEVAKKYYEYTDSLTPDVEGDGKGFAGFDVLANYIIVGGKQQGVEFINPTIKGAMIDKAKLKKIFDIYTKAMANGYFYSSGKFRSDNIKSGDIISYIGSTSGASYFPTWVEEKNNERKISLKVLPYPRFKDKDYYTVQQGAGMSMFKSEEKREEASAIFLKWFTSSEENMKFAMVSGYLPSNKEVYSSEEFKKAVEDMDENDPIQSNLKKVYEIVTDQIFTSKAYSASPFEGSYDIRRILETSLVEITDQILKDANSIKDSTGRENLIEKLSLDEYFETWISNIELELGKKDIPYEER